MEASPLEAPLCHVPIARGAVTNTSIASFDLQTFIDPLPLDQLLCYGPSTVHSWPAEDRDQILAVANRDMTIARRNVAELTRYLDTHAAHLACIYIIAILKVLIILTSFTDFNIFYDNYTSRSGVWGIILSHL